MILYLIWHSIGVLSVVLTAIYLKEEIRVKDLILALTICGVFMPLSVGFCVSDLIEKRDIFKGIREFLNKRII